MVTGSIGADRRTLSLCLGAPHLSVAPRGSAKMTARVHIIGAGLAGLAAALRLAPYPYEIVVHEAAPQAGGRCRSYFDATLGMVIDNGNHLLLSGNHAAQTFLREVGAEAELVGPQHLDFAFVDLRTGQRWRLRQRRTDTPWWIVMPGRRVPDTRLADYLWPLGLLKAPKGTPIKAAMDCHGRLYERLWHPFFLAALNTAPEEAEASLAATLLRETLMKGGAPAGPWLRPPDCPRPSSSRHWRGSRRKMSQSGSSAG